eukprot:6190628-Pleurochrysis_carterae.AAC.2
MKVVGAVESLLRVYAPSYCMRARLMKLHRSTLVRNVGRHDSIVHPRPDEHVSPFCRCAEAAAREMSSPRWRVKRCGAERGHCDRDACVL